MSRKLSTKWLFIYSFYDCIVVLYIFCRKLEAAGKMTSIQYY